MGDTDEMVVTHPANRRFGLDAAINVATPQRRAVERIKRKATGMAVAAAAEHSAHEMLGASEYPPSDSLEPPLARNCRCADADVKAYREGADWICLTCGHELSAQASRQLTLRARRVKRDYSPHVCQR
jgi:hypothetical protein